MKKLFFLKCECETEGLSFDVYKEPTELWISLWKRFPSQYYSVIERLQLCWRILTKKEVNLWSICLSENKIKEFKKFLNNVKFD